MKNVFLVWLGVLTSRNDLLPAAASVVTLPAATKVQLGMRSGRTSSAFGQEPKRMSAAVMWNVLPTKLLVLFWSNVAIALAIAAVTPAAVRLSFFAPESAAASAAFCSSVLREYV